MRYWHSLENLSYLKLDIINQNIPGIVLTKAYISNKMLFITAFVTDSTTLNNASTNSIIGDLKKCIKNIDNYNVDDNIIPGINIIINKSFVLTKSGSQINFYPGQHFIIISGLY